MAATSTAAAEGHHDEDMAACHERRGDRQHPHVEQRHWPPFLEQAHERSDDHRSERCQKRDHDARNTGIELSGDHVARHTRERGGNTKQCPCVERARRRPDDDQRSDEADDDRGPAPPADLFGKEDDRRRGDDQRRDKVDRGQLCERHVNQCGGEHDHCQAVEHGAAEHKRVHEAQCGHVPETDHERTDEQGRDRAAHGDDFAERIVLRGQLEQHVVDRKRRHRTHKCEHAAAIGGR